MLMCVRVLEVSLQLIVVYSMIGLFCGRMGRPPKQYLATWTLLPVRRWTKPPMPCVSTNYLVVPRFCRFIQLRIKVVAAAPLVTIVVIWAAGPHFIFSPVFEHSSFFRRFVSFGWPDMWNMKGPQGRRSQSRRQLVFLLLLLVVVVSTGFT